VLFTRLRQDALVAKKRQKSPVSAAEKELKAAVEKLRAQLAAAEKSAEKWRSRAKASKSDAAGLKSQLAAVRRRLAKAEASVEKWKGRAKSALALPAAAAARALASTPAAPVVALVPDPDSGESTPPTEPDESWNVTRLRAEARARGIPGYSRKTKDQLLTELRG